MLRVSIILTFLCFTFPDIKAQGVFTDALSAADSANQSAVAVSLNGYARGAAYFGGDDYDYASLFGEFALQGRISGQAAFLYGDVRFRDGLFFGERESHFELKEAYAGIRWNRADLFLGTQIVRWVRTDGFNPIDNINPVDYFFLSPDPDDQLTGNFMLRTSIRPFRNTEVEIIAIPFYKPSVYRYDLFDMGEEVSFSEGVLPETVFNNGTVAARVNVELPSAGFAFSYFRGYDPFYGFKLDDVAFLPDIDIKYRPEMYRKDALGFDMSLVADRWIVRIESSYNITDDYHARMHIPNPELYYVGALERSVGRVNAIFQYIGKYIIDFEQLKEPVIYDPDDPLDLYRYAFETVTYESTFYNRRIFQQQKEMNHALFLSLSGSFLYEELRTGFSASYNITSEEYFIRPEIKWNARDGMQISAGAHLMDGPDDSVYDMAGKVLGGFFTGIRMAF